MKSQDNLSLVLLFYNEEESVVPVVGELKSALSRSGFEFELILVDNGSRDRTPELIRDLAETDPRLKPVTVAENLGLGWGAISGLAVAGGSWIGYMGGDGQVDPSDVVRLFKLAGSGWDLIKVRRKERQDGFVRAWISNIYVMLVCLVFGMPFYDVNATPRIFRREWLDKFRLASRDWFLDAELLIKAHMLGMTVHELPIVFQKREGGSSNVNLNTIFEFLKNIARFRFGKELREWKRNNLSRL
ncbi:MAG: glycosyltransferase family 2 protein [Candidatus Erginobacter occultus]|nr:glycosyltransferase family 2 protein [Candidatus Erginobacter occultus]